MTDRIGSHTQPCRLVWCTRQACQRRPETTDIVAVELDLVTEDGDEDANELALEIAGAEGRDIVVVSVTGNGVNWWPTVVFAGPLDQVAAMLEDHGFYDGVEVYEV